MRRRSCAAARPRGAHAVRAAAESSRLGSGAEQRAARADDLGCARQLGAHGCGHGLALQQARRPSGAEAIARARRRVILSYLIRSYPIRSYPILSYLILSDLIRSGPAGPAARMRSAAACARAKSALASLDAVCSLVPSSERRRGARCCWTRLDWTGRWRACASKGSQGALCPPAPPKLPQAFRERLRR